MAEPEKNQAPVEEKEPAAPAEETEEEPEEDSVEARINKVGNLLSVEGVIMLPLAVFFDLISIILLIFALDDFGILDIFATILFCGWMFSRSQTIAAPQRISQKAEGTIKKVFRGKWSKFLTPIIGEVIPYVGALPFWTLAVYYELMS